MRRWCAGFTVALLLGPVGTHAAGRTTPLADAARAGDATALRDLLEQPVDVNAQEPDGSTALHWAAHRGSAAAVGLLLGAGARVGVASRYGVTPLSLAAASGNAAVVERLLKAGADPNGALPGGETVVMTASHAGRTEALRVLLAHGADVNARESTRNQTALMWAAAEGHVDVVRVLIQAGADMRAVSRGPLSPEGITDGESINRRVAPRVYVFTPLQFAVHAGRVEAARALLEAGADIADETPQGMGLLTLAIANAHYELAAFLLEAGADPNAAKIGWTPLHRLVRTRTLNIGQFPHPVATGSLTSLELAKLLLAHGVDVDARTTQPWADGWRGRFGLSATPLLVAAKGGDAQMMQLLADAGADLLAVNDNGTSALMAAAGVEMFNPNEDSGTNADGLAALRVAVAVGAGDVNGINLKGETALHGAVHRASNEIIQFLVDSGARLDIENEDGLTPIQLAVRGVGIGRGTRPAQAGFLRDLMVARGMAPPDLAEDTARYSFGVEIK